MEGTWYKMTREVAVQNRFELAAVADLVKNDCQIASRMIAESLNIPKTVVLWILKDDFGKRKLYTSFVPNSLTPEQTEDRVTSCQDIIAMAEAEKHFFSQNCYGRRDLVFCLWPGNKTTEFWMGWWEIPLAEGALIPQVPHQDHVDNFFRLSKT